MAKCRDGDESLVLACNEEGREHKKRMADE